MSAGAGFTRAEIDELTRVYSTLQQARTLLRRAGFPPVDIPFADGPRSLWAQVADLVEAGLYQNARGSILAEAQDMYPGNPVFGASRGTTALQPVPPLAAARQPRVLFFGASPRGQGPLRWDKDLKAVQSNAGAAYTVDSYPAATVNDLSRIHTTPPDVFHFAGHSEDSTLLFEDPDGEAYPIPAADVAALLGFGPRLRLALLNCCYGELLAEHFQPVAELVIAFRGRVDDKCAAYFVDRFYTAVAADADFRTAARLAAQATATVDEACRSFADPTGLIILPIRNDKTQPSQFLTKKAPDTPKSDYCRCFQLDSAPE